MDNLVWRGSYHYRINTQTIDLLNDLDMVRLG